MSGWHDDVFFGIHYDFHAQLHDTEIGARLTKEHLVERFSRTKPDWVQCDCKGHPGWASWNTKVGSTSPGVVKDSVRIHREATAELDIKLGMHYSGVIDVRATQLHPDWAALDADGNPYPRGITCRNSGYADELMIPQLLELVKDYEVDGFWIDGDNWGSRPCWCDRCRADFRAKTGLVSVPRKAGDANWQEWIEYHRKLFVDYVTEYADAVHAENPDCAVCSNWMYTLRQPEPIQAPVDYLSGDYTWDWGAERAALEGRMLDGRMRETGAATGSAVAAGAGSRAAKNGPARSRSWDLMVWGFSIIFNKDDEFAGVYQMKNPLHLEQEVSEVLALGGALMVYVNPERNGRLVGWQNDIIAEVGEFARERKEWCFQTDSASEAAVLHPAASHYSRNDPLFNFGKSHLPIEGALHGLLENHISADLITDAGLADLVAGQSGDRPAAGPRYKLLVVPERAPLDPPTADAIRRFAEAGGSVLMSGANLSTAHPDLVGAAFKDEIENRGPAGGLMHMAAAGQSVGFAGTWSVVEPSSNVEVLKHALASREPDEPDTSRPLVTMRKLGKGRIVAVHGPIFWNYWRKHYPVLRSLIDELVEASGFTPEIDVTAGPELEVIARRRGDTLLVNLVNRGAGEMLGPNRPMIETLPPSRDVTIRVRRASRPTRVTLRPSGSDLPFTYVDGVAEIRVGEVPIYEIVEVE